MMKANSYLYGEGIDVPEIPADIVMRRIELLKDHLTELMSVDYRQRDASRYNRVLEAIDFWESINLAN